MFATLECDGSPRAFVWKNGEPHELPAIDGRVMFMTGRNDRGGVVGIAHTDIFGGGGEGQPVLWQAGELFALPLPPGTDRGEVTAVNDDGVFIGTFDDGDRRVLFVGDAEGVKLLVHDDPWRNPDSTGIINNRGDIANTISEENFTSVQTHLWRPAPCEPGAGA